MGVKELLEINVDSGKPLCNSLNVISEEIGCERTTLSLVSSVDSQRLVPICAICCGNGHRVGIEFGCDNLLSKVITFISVNPIYFHII